MAMIFQEPMTALNPVVPVGRQIDEVRAPIPISMRRRGSSASRHDGAGAPAAGRAHLASYPHRLSGGQRQRIMIAMALVLETEAAHRRRADHRARRHHAEADFALIRDLQRDHGTAVLSYP